MRRISPYGATAFVVEASSVDEVIGLAAAPRPPGVFQTIPGARSLLVECAQPADPAVVATAAEFYAECSVGTVVRAASAIIDIPVVYDGDDLASVAQATGMSVADVIATHSDADYRVALCGFTPGFAYIAGLPASLHLPRRASPRERVPAGCVAIAGEWTGVYPRATPGGWHLLGTTTVSMWDAERDQPARLQPGDTVRFIPT